MMLANDPRNGAYMYASEQSLKSFKKKMQMELLKHHLIIQKFPT